MENATLSPANKRGEQPSGRLERRKARTRAAILASASDLFRSQGFEGTSVQQIAFAAETGVGTVYGYFPSKDALLAEVLRLDRDEAIAEYMGIVREDTSTIDRVCTAMEVVARYLTAHRTILISSFLAGLRVHTLDGQPAGWLLGAFGGLLSEGMARGEFRDLPVDATARLLIGTVVSAYLGIGTWQGREDDPSTMPELLALTRALLLR